MIQTWFTFSLLCFVHKQKVFCEVACLNLKLKCTVFITTRHHSQGKETKFLNSTDTHDTLKIGK